MATVYLKNRKTIQVSLEELPDYLYENHDIIETRHLAVRRLYLKLKPPS